MLTRCRHQPLPAGHWHPPGWSAEPHLAARTPPGHPSSAARASGADRCGLRQSRSRPAPRKPLSIWWGRLDPPLTFRGPERALGRSVSRAENQDVSASPECRLRAVSARRRILRRRRRNRKWWKGFRLQRASSDRQCQPLSVAEAAWSADRAACRYLVKQTMRSVLTRKHCTWCACSGASGFCRTSSSKHLKSA
jgi:hypothetical protein